MKDYVSSLMAEVKAKNPAEPEFHQAVQEVADSLALVLDRHPEYRPRASSSGWSSPSGSSCSASPGWTTAGRSRSTAASASR